jgi:hypothetical protein
MNGTEACSIQSIKLNKIEGLRASIPDPMEFSDSDETLDRARRPPKTRLTSTWPRA